MDLGIGQAENLDAVYITEAAPQTIAKQGIDENQKPTCGTSLMAGHRVWPRKIR